MFFGEFNRAKMIYSHFNRVERLRDFSSNFKGYSVKQIGGLKNEKGVTYVALVVLLGVY